MSDVFKIESNRFRDLSGLLEQYAREFVRAAALMHAVENGALKMPGSRSAGDSIEMFMDMRRSLDEARRQLAPWAALFATVRRYAREKNLRMDAALAVADHIPEPTQRVQRRHGSARTRD